MANIRCPRCGSWMVALHIAIKQQKRNQGIKEELRVFGRGGIHNPSAIGCADCGYESTVGEEMKKGERK